MQRNYPFFLSQRNQITVFRNDSTSPQPRPDHTFDAVPEGIFFTFFTRIQLMHFIKNTGVLAVLMCCTFFNPGVIKAQLVLSANDGSTHKTTVSRGQASPSERSTVLPANGQQSPSPVLSTSIQSETPINPPSGNGHSSHFQQTKTTRQTDDYEKVLTQNHENKNNSNHAFTENLSISGDTNSSHESGIQVRDIKSIDLDQQY